MSAVDLAVAQLVDAWTNPGEASGVAAAVHWRSQERLRHEWPALQRAIDELVQLATAPPWDPDEVRRLQLNRGRGYGRVRTPRCGGCPGDPGS